MSIKRILRTIAIIAMLSCNVGCDQISKRLVRQNVNYHQRIGLFNNHVTITKIENTGAFLSFGQSLAKPIRTILFTFIPLVILGIALIYLVVNKDLAAITIIGICFIIGGGIGNIYDRILFGSVTDFLHIDFVLFQTGIFNMADVSVMLGTFLVLGGPLFQRRHLNQITVNQLKDRIEI